VVDYSLNITSFQDTQFVKLCVFVCEQWIYKAGGRAQYFLSLSLRCPSIGAVMDNDVGKCQEEPPKIAFHDACAGDVVLAE